MNLVHYLLEQTKRWAFVFPQERSLSRAIALAFGILCGVGKRTLTRAISFQGNTQKDWSADYKVFSRSPWEARALFHPILEQAIQEQGLQRVVISTDDTRVWRNGRHVPQTQWHRDPLGPPFQTNLRWGHRFLQASLVVKPSLLARRGPQTAPAPAGGGAGRLSHQQERAQVLPQARLPVDQRFDHPGGAVAAGLL